jgi:6-phosphofructokinase 1
MSRTIGVLTSSGDCAGLNAAIRAVVTRAVMGHGWSVKGIRYATRGLMERPVNAISLGPRAMDGQMLQMGGTIWDGQYRQPLRLEDARWQPSLTARMRCWKA